MPKRRGSSTSRIWHQRPCTPLRSPGTTAPTSKANPVSSWPTWPASPRTARSSRKSPLRTTRASRSPEFIMLTNQVALVTGAGSGIGRAIAQSLAREGARVVVTDVADAACQETVDVLQAAGGVGIVNVASVMGQVAGPKLAAYVASKHGVVGLTKAAAVEFASQGVRINAVGPGYIRTPMLTQKDDTTLKTLVDRHPVGRLGEPEEIAETVAWLC